MRGNQGLKKNQIMSFLFSPFQYSLDIQIKPVIREIFYHIVLTRDVHTAFYQYANVSVQRTHSVITVTSYAKRATCVKNCQLFLIILSLK